jgi:ABC-type nitrate/sulfonate/bicarbonate transport system substrate-binding protein
MRKSSPAGLIVAIAVAACARMTNSAMAQGPAPSPDHPVRVTLVGSTVNPPSVTNIYYLAATTGGFFKKYGIDLEMQQSTGSPTSLAAVVSGRAQFASINMITLADVDAVLDQIAARLAALRDAFIVMGRDEDFREDQMRDGSPEPKLMAGADAAQFVDQTFGTLSPTLAQRINSFGLE